MNWVSAEEALERLGVRRQTLYAYVSRGLLRARPDEDDPRRSLYALGDLTQLKGRRRGARRRAEVAAGAIAWGEPVLESAISTVRDGRLILRGRPVEDLAARATLEEVASLLWSSAGQPAPAPAQKPDGATAKARAFRVLARHAAEDAPSLGRSASALAEDAWRLLPAFADALAGASGSGPVHARLARAWKTSARGAQLIRRAVVLMADHELNPSTFAVRIAASTGAPLAACALAGMSTLAGPLHGEAAARALAQIDLLLAAKAPAAELKAMVARGENFAGWSHPLYPDGDPRAANLLAALKPRAPMLRILNLISRETGERPNCDAALAALTRELGLPDDAPFCIFALGRLTGWLAHAIEQRANGRIIRPRARYVGE
ncbi:MAG: citrate synthase [Hyphomonadaceae bacterium]